MRFLRPALAMISFTMTLSANPAADATNAGGVRIFQAAAKASPLNVCLSPFSLQSALAMTYAGAGGKTRAEMGAALAFPADSDALASSFQQLAQGLEKSVKRGGSETSLNVANRLFGAEGFAFRKPFLDLCAARFGAPLEGMDFRASPALAAAHINGWVAGQTHDRIQNLIPASALTKATTLVLANALYLKIPWEEEFQTAPELQFLLSGSTRESVPAIRHTGSLGYKKTGGFTAVGIPFRGREFQFLILLPDGASLPGLSPELLAGCASLPPAEVALTIPKFRLEPPTLPLGDILQKLGMPSAFDMPRGSSDFDGIAPRKPDDYLYLSDVFHKTFFALDEKGIEAAAATAVVMMRATAMPVQVDPVEVRVDRPFLFAVQHVPTGACLFLGRLSDPR